MRLESLVRITIATLLLMAAGCAPPAPYVWVYRMPRPKAPESLSTINPGDLLDVRVFGQPDISAKGTVRLDGTLTLPLVGQVQVAGKRPEDASAELQQRLTKFVIKPDVTVVIEQSRVNVAVIGEVRAAGVVELDSPANVLSALAKAGGMTDFADEDGIYVLRKMGPQTVRVRFTYKLLTGADPAAINFTLKQGDVVVVE
jgi:polysaccharide export outer membrane protein